jgi:hypothetical protein
MKKHLTLADAFRKAEELRFRRVDASDVPAITECQAMLTRHGHKLVSSVAARILFNKLAEATAEPSAEAQNGAVAKWVPAI